MTQISISNIAWDTTDDALVAKILASLDVLPKSGRGV